MSLDAMQLEPTLRDDALARAKRTIAQWNIALPDVTPLVIDFGLGDYNHVGLIEYWLANEIAAGYCGKYMFVFDGQMCPTHRHHDKHETFFVVQGTIVAQLENENITLAPGDRLAIPPGHWHNFRGQGDALMLELSMPCHVNDNEFQDPRIMTWLHAALKQGAK